MVVQGQDQATFSTTFASIGTYTIIAVYSGDIDFSTSTSSVFNGK